jgi:hypothetical protein
MGLNTRLLHAKVVRNTQHVLHPIEEIGTSSMLSTQTESKVSHSCEFTSPDINLSKDQDKSSEQYATYNG